MPSIQEIYPFGVFPASRSKVEEIEVKPDTSWDEEITRKLFEEFNQELLRIPGDSSLVIISDSEEEEEGVDVVLAKAFPQLPTCSQGTAFSSTEEEEKEDLCAVGQVFALPFLNPTHCHHYRKIGKVRRYF
jgi:hypothetical protein